ncbi:DUF6531 domain-containing protein [Candidatus Amarobacter glycogenicus]|uniref:DUF6531 domain-containing protein n=1 Tax=Candidatus Amarobacter glycogenicus TaxID=3140699 RepID=UPI003134DBCC|nr:hypothetical protein [Dehalococcoidia bacterium]
MPLNFRRFYTGHSDRLGTLGYRWSHSYDTRLTFADNNDVGVVFGAGGEEFFDGNSSWVFTRRTRGSSTNSSRTVTEHSRSGRS